jgi:anhydro-N-acetylmuramic acid kinase
MDCKDTITHSLKKSWKVVGIMSGTSLDGLDVGVAYFTRDNNGMWSGKLEEITCFNFHEALMGRLRKSMQMTALELCELDRDWALFAAECVKVSITNLTTKPDLLSSHGHTVFHKPGEGFTTQIGSGAILAAEIGLPVVCDLRSSDVAYGGTGAPLIPLVDKLLFSEYDGCLNLGGFSNISHLNSSTEVLAWDIGPCNNLLNQLSRIVGLEYDKDGLIASKGELNSDLLRDLSELSYHHQSAPKSLGMEWVESELSSVLNKYDSISVGDKLRTAVEYIAKLIVNDSPSGRVLVSGGGVWNAFLMERIRKLSVDKFTEFVIAEPDMANGKEAYGFAFLGLLRWLGENNVYQEVTGASKPSSGGAVWLP